MNNSKCSTKTGVFLLCSGHAVIDFYNNFLPALLPLLIVKYDISLTLSGMLIMIIALTGNITQPMFGYLFDKYNSSKMIIVTVAVAALSICSVGYVPNEVAMLFLLIVLALMVAAYHPLGSGLNTSIVNKDIMGRAMSYYVAGGNLGFALAPTVVMAFIVSYGLEELIWLSIPGLLLAAAYWATGLYKLPSSRRKENKKLSAQGNNETIWQAMRNPSVMKMCSAMGLRCWTYMAINMFLPLMMIEKGVSAMYSGVMLTIFLGGTVAGGLIGGELGDRLNHKTVITGSLLLAIPCIYYFFNSDGTGIDSLVALFLCGALTQAGQPSSIVWAQRLMPKFIGVASGMMMGASFGFGSIGAAITAALGEQIGLHTSLLITCVPSTLLAALLVKSIPYTEE